MKLNQYHVLLMDLDDTLFDTQHAMRSAITDLLESYGIDCSREMAETYTRLNQECWNRLEKGEITKKQLKTLRFQVFFDACGLKEDPVKAGEDYSHFLSQHGELLEGAEDLLSDLSERFALYAVTNGIQRVQEGRLKRSGIGHYFGQVFVSETVGEPKPSKAYFDYVFAHLPGISHSECLLIGDSLTSDMKGGENVDLDTMWYNPHHLSSDPETPVTYTVDSYDAIRDMLL